MCSEQRKVKSGVSTKRGGTITIFSQYVNDKLNCLKYTQASMFAVDTSLSCTRDSPK